jgi:hypothetical protein
MADGALESLEVPEPDEWPPMFGQLPECCFWAAGIW